MIYAYIAWWHGEILKHRQYAVRTGPGVLVRCGCGKSFPL